MSLNLPDGASVRDAFSTLTERYPALAEMEPFTTFARNRRVVDRGERLADGDELALLQPVSGGAGGRVLSDGAEAEEQT